MSGEHVHNAAPIGPASVEQWVRRTGIAIAIGSVIGLALRWPRGDAPDLGVQPQSYVEATVQDVATGTCPGIDVNAPSSCRMVTARLTGGPEKGDLPTFQVLDTEFEVPDLSSGDKIVLLDVRTAPPAFRYSFSDFQRSVPIIWLGVAFVLAVVVFGRWQGLRALAGLGASALLLVVFVVPALLRGEPAVLVALVATAAIGCLALYLAHGFTTATTVALLGTMASVLLIAGIAVLLTSVARLSGLASEDAQILRVAAFSDDS